MPDITNPPTKKRRKKNGTYLYYYETMAFAVGTPVFKFYNGSYAKADPTEHEMDDDSIVTADSNGKISALTAPM